MDSTTVLRDNLADLTSYGLLTVGLLILGFAVLDVITPGSLRTMVWREGHRNAVVLAVSQVLGVTLAVAAGIAASVGLELWRGVLYTFVYGVVTIALMAFAFVLVDLLTPGRLGSVLLEDDDHGPAVWMGAALFVAVGLAVAASLSLF
ncbi:DUF350 domain-containing protein [Gordonia sp. VNK21]|uniref:DUF350 domain-containing protein n=1 Tax=Gordonia sp. VNK21 TaxID=3382483 RepID=UPI0038D4484C